MVVDAVSVLDPATLDLRMIGTKKVQGGGLRDSFLVDGVAFKKTFSYAGFEMQPKSYSNPKILLLNIELELKSEKENAEVSLCDFWCQLCMVPIIGCSLACLQLPIVSAFINGMHQLSDFAAVVQLEGSCLDQHLQLSTKKTGCICKPPLPSPFRSCMPM